MDYTKTIIVELLPDHWNSQENANIFHHGVKSSQFKTSKTLKKQENKWQKVE